MWSRTLSASWARHVPPDDSTAARCSRCTERLRVSEISSRSCSGGTGYPASFAASSTRPGSIPAPTAISASSRYRSMTRLVKNPRLSRTTMGVFPSSRAYSRADDKVFSDVRVPTIVSTSRIRSTGEKKCMPTNVSGRDNVDARVVIGSVDVVDASTVPGSVTASIVCRTCCLTATFSATASTTNAEGPRSERRSVISMRSSKARDEATSVVPESSARASRRSAYCRPRRAPCRVRATSTTSAPARAHV